MGSQLKNLASRESYWDELGDKEKIEKLSTWVEIEHNRIRDLEDQIAQLFRHKHLDGALVISIVDSQAASTIGWPNKNPLNRERK